MAKPTPSAWTCRSGSSWCAAGGRPGRRACSFDRACQEYMAAVSEVMPPFDELQKMSAEEQAAISARIPRYKYNGPTWCFSRFGQSETVLPDSSRVLIAGEHEDWYDPDFHIYNDVVVIRPDKGADQRDRDLRLPTASSFARRTSTRRPWSVTPSTSSAAWATGARRRPARPPSSGWTSRRLPSQPIPTERRPARVDLRTQGRVRARAQRHPSPGRQGAAAL